MNPSMLRIRLTNAILIILLLSACGVPATTAVPVTSTVTPIPPTITATATITPTATPADTSTPSPLLHLCKLPEAAHHRDIGLGFPRYATRMVSTGTVRAKVIFVDFSDAPANETPEQVFSRISPGAPDFYRAVSYNRLNLELEPHFAWLRMSKPSTEYMFERGLSFDLHKAYVQEAITLADGEVDFSDVQAVYVMANPEATAISYGPGFTPVDKSFGIPVDGNTITNGATSGFDLKDWGFLWLNHEAGHTLGLVDLYSYENTSNYDDIYRFVGNFSLMGYIAGRVPEPLAYERWLLGWIDDDQIICQPTGEETTTLSAIEKEGGIKAVIVPTGPTSAVIVESRRALGYDSNIIKPGSLVYSIDTSISTGQGPIRVFPMKDNDPYRDQSPLAVGESVTVGNVTITVTDASADGDTVQVTVAE
ncbi:MAG TPA: M6 family metalloprotease domain-containing protein [Anaerolineales bacterium]|nr:M6 family metalloprotease domain-containing protein [Anaerolineales bacterium]